jgi:glycerol-3-phosphate dehydrogenase (NAD(P)+)
MTTFKHAGVIGAGAWGTALAQVCARAGLQVTLQARETEVVDSIKAKRENTLFLAGVALEPEIDAVADMAGLASCDLILAVAPAQHLRSALKALAPHLRAGVPVVPRASSRAP